MPDAATEIHRDLVDPIVLQDNKRVQAITEVALLVRTLFLFFFFFVHLT